MINLSTRNLHNIRNLHRGTDKFKKNYQSRTNSITEEKTDLLANSHNILKRGKNYFCQLLNVHGCNDVRQTSIQAYK
jgi:hypothetical protein